MRVPYIILRKSEYILSVPYIILTKFEYIVSVPYIFLTKFEYIVSVPYIILTNLILFPQFSQYLMMVPQTKQDGATFHSSKFCVKYHIPR